MKKRSKKLGLKIFIGVFLAYAFSMSAFACICANGAGDGYIPEKTNGTNVIETYVIEGAGYFLNANSSILLLLNKVEMAELKGADYSEFRTILDDAVYNMKEAKLTYDNLIKTAEATPYNQNVITILKTFNYDAFAENNGLNSLIFKVVENHLGSGDITGSFKKINTKFTKIIDMLAAMSETISSNQTPDISALWKLNQESSQTLLFGQYIAQVFYELRKTK
jgi:hypothetical protein